MPTTSNFGWTTPADTDLVKDGAAAIRTLGNGVDTSFVDLKGGTTGQILSKNSNTDLDFTWVAPTTGDITGVTAGTGLTGGGTSGDVTISLNTSSVYVVPSQTGNSGKYLTTDGTNASWGTVSAGSNWSLLNSGGTALTGAATITVSGISGKDKIMVIVEDAGTNGTAANITVRVNGITTGDKYKVVGGYHQADSTYQTSTIVGTAIAGQGYTNFIPLARITTGNSNAAGGVTLTGCNSSGVKQFISTGSATAGGQSDQRAIYCQGYVDETNSVSSISVFSSNGNFDSGTVYVYASA